MMECKSPGFAGVAFVMHESWCSYWINGECNCHPDIHIEEIKECQAH